MPPYFIGHYTSRQSEKKLISNTNNANQMHFQDIQRRKSGWLIQQAISSSIFIQYIQIYIHNTHIMYVCICDVHVNGHELMNRSMNVHACMMYVYMYEYL